MTRSPVTPPSPLITYAVALLTPAVAVAAALVFDPIIKTTLGFFIVAVLFSAWYGGFKPGFICTVISMAFLAYFLVEPRYSFMIDAHDIPALTLFFFIGFIISVIEESRLRTERALRQSRDQLEVVLEGINDGVIAQDPTGQPVFANQAASNIIGYKDVSQVLKKPLQETRARLGFFDANGKVVPQSELPSTKAFVHGISSQLIMRWTYTDGSSDRWISLRSTPVFDHVGKVQMAISIFSDITEEKDAEINLRNAHEQLQTILANIKSAVIATDTEGRVGLMNASAENLTGWTQEQGIKRPFEDVVTLLDESSHILQNPIQSVLHDGIPIEINNNKVTRLVNKNGHIIPIEYNAAPLRDEYRSVMGAIITFRDISERYKADRERMELTMLLAAQQKRLENILSNVPGIVWESAVSPDAASQSVNFINEYAEKLLGYSREEWLTSPDFVKMIVYPDDLEASGKQVQAIYESGSLAGTVQFRAITKDGRVLPIEAHYSLLTDERGNIVGTCGLMTDISQHKADENALRQSALDLKRSNEQLEQFAYVASHDLQEPLRMITSYLQLLERRYKTQLDADASEFIAYAVDGATRMKALINDLLAYSRVKTGEKNFKRFTMETALKQACNNLQVLITEQNAVITHDQLPEIFGDEAQFVQLFQNLLSNAIKFHNNQPPVVVIKSERVGHEWKLSVRDNGIGMEPQYLERIFVIFQRLHSKEQYPGTGIGLAICKKVVEHHGGRIWAESAPGVGTTFWFTIPVR